MNMRPICLITVGVFLFTFITNMTNALWAGQVVTDSHRSWAKNAVVLEKTVEGAYSPETLAVLYFSNHTGKSELDPLQKGLAVMLISDLSKVEGIKLVERPKLQALVEEIGLGESGLVDPGTVPRVGRLLKSAHVVGGKFDKLELQTFSIDPGILNTSAERISDLPDSKGLLGEIFRMEKEVLFEILEYLKKSPKLMTLEEVLKTPMTTSLEALLFFFKGIHESDQGNYQIAANFYRKSLKADPRLILAADSLKELETLGLLKDPDDTISLLKENANSSSLPKPNADSSSFPGPNADSRTSKPEDWRNDYLAMLKKGKAVRLPSGQPSGAGLAYTPPEAVTLENAISKALEKEKGARVCECMKLAVDLEYNAYLVIKTIYEAGGSLEIDQLCMCATEAGVMKAIIAKAAREAISPLGSPVYAQDEIAQASCFQGEEGLAYTPGEVPLDDIPVDTYGQNNSVSPFVPGRL
ncbi:MAG: CsgG/HfaB family protein [Pseudomonadota bacterium]